jgi:signal peptidase I
MSEDFPLPPQSSGQEFPPLLQPTCSRKRPILAAFASAIAPGTGQMIFGEWPKAMILVALFAMLIAAFWPLRLLRYYAGFLLLVVAIFALFLYSTCSAFFSRRDAPQLRLSRWWILLTLPLCVLAMASFIAIMFRFSGFRSLETPSTAMEPTLRKGESFMVDTRSRAPRRGKIVVFSMKDGLYVKRVIAIGGDTIQGQDGSIFVNDVEQNEPYIQHVGTPPESMINFGPTKIPQGQLFVMGDNRDISLDSRSPEIGLLDSKSIIGTPLYVVRSKSEGKAIQ